MRRAIRLNYSDNTHLDLELSKAVLIKSDKPMINLEKLKDDSFRLIWSEGLIEDFSKLVNMEIIRED